MGRKLISTVPGLALGLAVAVYAGFQSARAERQLASPAGGVGPDIPSPATWVAFTADLRKTEQIDGISRVTIEGKQYRSSDGSTRLESGLSGGPVGVISIRNISLNRFFILMNGHWSSFPMRLPPWGHRPSKRRVDMVGMSGQAELFEGHTVYRYRDANGIVSLRAPELNFFPLRVENNNVVQEYINVQLGEPPPELFMPPAGADVEIRQELSGIVWHPSGKDKAPQELDQQVWPPRAKHR